MIVDQIIADLKKALKKQKIIGVEPNLEHPAQEQHGDYSTNLAMVLAKKLKQSPLSLAKKIADAYPENDYLEKIEIAGPGFINLRLKKEFLSKQLKEVLEKKEAFGKTSLLKGKEMMVEFAHPNTHKPFHIGHLRNISLGESIVRLLASQGAKVVRANYQGDVGLHIAKCLYGIQNSKFKMQNLKTLDEKIEFLGKAYVAGAKAYDSNPKARLEIEELNRKIYQKDTEVVNLWQETRDWSLEYFEKIYNRVYSHFDRYYFESEVAEPGKRIVLEGLKRGVFVKSEGAIIFPGEKYGFHNRVFINQQGLPTYEAKDMGLGSLQFSEFKPDLIIHVVGPEQKGYFEVVFKALENLMPKTQGKEYHLIYGWVRLKTGKMSSRTGEVVLAEWLLDEIKKRLDKTFKMTGSALEIVSVGAVKYSFLRVSPGQEIAFDIDESVNLEGDSGPYLQYTYARCSSVLRKSGRDMYNKLVYYTQELPRLTEEERIILRTIYKFPEIVRDAARAYWPNLICNFLFDLSKKYNLFYDKWSILKPREGQNQGTGKIRDFRLILTAAVAQILKNGLYLLGIKTLEKM